MSVVAEINKFDTYFLARLPSHNATPLRIAVDRQQELISREGRRSDLESRAGLGLVMQRAWLFFGAIAVPAMSVKYSHQLTLT